MSCRGGSCSCGKEDHLSQSSKQALVKMEPSQGIVPNQDLIRGLESLSLDEELVEVRFKNNRRIIYRNINGLKLHKDDRVVVEATEGYNLGTVTLTGTSAQKCFDEKAPQIKKSSLNQIYRLATLDDLGQWIKTKKRERELLLSACDLAAASYTDLHIGDVEFQSDGKKATLFYAAGSPQEPPDLIRKLEIAFGVKVEMKQILSQSSGTLH